MKKAENLTLGREANHVLRSVNDMRQRYWQHFGGYFAADLPESLVEEANYLLEDLFDILGDVAPKGCYFDSPPNGELGYGFWLSDVFEYNYG